jgi:elongation factor G
MDRTGADFFGVVENIQEILGANAVPIVVPIGKEDTFEGVIDLLTMKAVYYDDTDKGVTYHEEDIPPDKTEKAKKWRANLVEKCAEQCDTLLEKFLQTGDLSLEEMTAIIRKATMARRVIPVYCGSAFKNKGIQRLLDGVVSFLPSPADLPPIIHASDETTARTHSDDEPFSALAFKIIADKHMGKLVLSRVYSGVIEAGQTVYNSTQKLEQRVGRIIRLHANRQEAIEEARCGDIVALVGLTSTKTGDTLCCEDNPILLESIEFPAPVMSVSIRTEDRVMRDRLGTALRSLSDEDPTFLVTYDQETSETILSGMGELHLDVLVERMRREYGVQAEIGKPEVAYRETGTTVQEASYKHVKQSGGRGQYAHVVMSLEPLDAGKGFSFVNAVKGGNVPTQFVPSVEKGVIKAMRAGPYAGYPVVDMQVTLLDGSYHEVDSSDFAFQEAGRMCFRQLFLQSRPILIEPIMSVEITVPDDYMGAASGSICQRRGRIESMEGKAGNKIISGMVPLAEMFGYAGAIRTLTQGRGTFTMHFEHYEAVPLAQSEQIIARRREQDKIR